MLVGGHRLSRFGHDLLDQPEIDDLRNVRLAAAYREDDVVR
jgi:hypothetical protein